MEYTSIHIEERVEHAEAGEPIRPPVLHQLKSTTENFHAVRRGAKRAELRKDDRGYQVGDYILLTEVHEHAIGDATELRSTGESELVRITHKLPGGEFGLDSTWCMLSIEVLASYQPAALAA